jgi:hypothetical protein
MMSDSGDRKPHSLIAISLVIPWLLSLATVAVGIWQFTTEQAQTNKAPFLKKQLELCFLASETAARLATETDPATWEKDRQTFWQLYWGNLAIGCGNMRSHPDRRAIAQPRASAPPDKKRSL